MATSVEDARELAFVSDKRHSTRNIETGGVQLTDEEVEAILDGFEKEDDSEKTWMRRIVENYLMHVSVISLVVLCCV